MRKLIRVASSPVVVSGLLFAMALWYLLLAASGAVSWGWQPFDLRVFRLSSVLLLLSLLSGAANAILAGKKRLPEAAAFSAAALLLLSAGYGYLSRCDATIMLAEGETYQAIPSVLPSVEMGPLARLPEVSFSVSGVNRGGKEGVVEIVQEGAASSIGASWTKIRGGEIRFAKAGVAPLFIVSAREEGELERNYIKLDLEPPGKEQWFMFNFLPYDFFLRKEKGGAGAASWFLDVGRGKLKIFEGALPQGGKVRIQNVDVTVQGDKRFAILEFRRRRGVTAAVICAALLAVSLGAAAVRRTAGRAGG